MLDGAWWSFLFIRNTLNSWNIFIFIPCINALIQIFYFSDISMKRTLGITTCKDLFFDSFVKFNGFRWLNYWCFKVDFNFATRFCWFLLFSENYFLKLVRSIWFSQPNNKLTHQHFSSSFLYAIRKEFLKKMFKCF